jgi:hypothetical protein
LSSAHFARQRESPHTQPHAQRFGAAVGAGLGAAVGAGLGAGADACVPPVVGLSPPEGSEGVMGTKPAGGVCPESDGCEDVVESCGGAGGCEADSGVGDGACVVGCGADGVFSAEGLTGSVFLP